MKNIWDVTSILFDRWIAYLDTRASEKYRKRRLTPIFPTVIVLLAGGMARYVG